MSLQKLLENKFIRLFSLKNNSKNFLMICFLISFFIFDLSKAESNNSNFEKINQLELDYLESKKELEDYIIDTGDILLIEFDPTTELNNTYEVSAEGEIFLPRLDGTYVRGLTTSELQNLLEKRYLEFLIEPKLKVRIAGFKSLRVLVRGEVRYPGLYKFPAYRSGLYLDFQKTKLKDYTGVEKAEPIIGEGMIESSNESTNDSINVKRTTENITTITDVIRKAGGITSTTDLSRIEIIRDIPLGKGGGKKRAFVNLNSYLNESDDSYNLRIFDGDSIFIPKLASASPEIIPKSILSGLSPRFIEVDVFGRVETPGRIKLPLEASLSDVISLSGPIKPLSGKIVLIRYNKDGTVLNQNISYSARAKKGSKRNPYVKQGDLISIKNSVLGKSTEVIREFTAPFVGIYSAKELIEGF